MISDSCFDVAMIQLNTGTDKQRNLEKIDLFINEAASRGARFVTLPETCTYLGGIEGSRAAAEDVGGETTEFFARKARQHKIWVHGGSIYEKIPDSEKLYNTTLLMNPQGELAAVYRKIHLFDIEVPGGVSSKESDLIEGGRSVVTFGTDWGRMGLAICYDLRFPEIYRILALRGARVVFNPAGFALYTGRDHWETLIRARAIENQCYMICANQIGKKTAFQTLGRSVTVDPWGITTAAASDTEGVVMTRIDLDYVEKVRAELPSLANRKEDVYRDAWDDEEDEKEE